MGLPVKGGGGNEASWYCPSLGNPEGLGGESGGQGQPCPGAAVSPPSEGGVPDTRGPSVAMAMRWRNLFAIPRTERLGCKSPSEALRGRERRWGSRGGAPQPPPHPEGYPTAPTPPGTASPCSPLCSAGGPGSPGTLGGDGTMAPLPTASWMPPAPPPPPRHPCQLVGLPNMGLCSGCYINTAGSISCCLVKGDGDVNRLWGAEVAFWRGCRAAYPPHPRFCKPLLPGGLGPLGVCGGAVQ